MTDDVFNWYTERFGARWKAALARALGLTRETVTLAKPGQPAHNTIIIVAELLDVLPMSRWPSRFDELKRMAKAKERKESENAA